MEKLHQINDVLWEAVKNSRFGTFKKLATHTNIDNSLLSKILHGYRKPTTDQVAKICKALEKSAAELGL